MAVRGPNGSGKSSLLRVIAGQLSVREGEVIRNCQVGWLDQHAGSVSWCIAYCISRWCFFKEN